MVDYITKISEIKAEIEAIEKDWRLLGKSKQPRSIHSWRSYRRKLRVANERLEQYRKMEAKKEVESAPSGYIPGRAVKSVSSSTARAMLHNNY